MVGGSRQEQACDGGMQAAIVPSLLVAVGSTPNGSNARGKRYRLATLLTLAVCAMLSGACILYAIAQWG